MDGWFGDALQSMMPTHPNIQYASYTNRARDRINTSVFNNYCASNLGSGGVVDGALVILMDCMERKSNDNIFIPLKQSKYVWEMFAESDLIRQKRKPRFDPALKVFRDCPMMLK